MSRPGLLCATVAIAASAGIARADDQAYRGSIAVADGAGAAILGLSALTDGPATDVLLIAGGITCLVAGPTTHLLHGNPGRAGASVAAHLLLPAIGIKLGADMGRSIDSGIEHAIVGAIVGHVLASALDIALAYSDGSPAVARVLAVSL